MEEYKRAYPLLSACGLNCGLCPRFHTEGDSRCPGCGGAGFFTKRPGCGVISCARRHGDIEYCYLCGEYPCKRLCGAECKDSFITHRNMRRDFEKAKTGGIETYQAELGEKIEILTRLLRDYNDGRRKGFYCAAVNLLVLGDLKQAMAKIELKIDVAAPAKERAAKASALLQATADNRGVDLVLNTKGRES